ncbi:MAG TPA: phage tail assembly chaperone [Sphingomicrobium sp.]|nr:phage tail assembly chaperone [Sphingomicrobium sp.]
MINNFGEAAARLGSAASLLLGWRPDEFWNSTPAELALAMTCSDAASEMPDAKTIEALRQRFPDQ